jgi:hypothetical protein
MDLEKAFLQAIQHAESLAERLGSPAVVCEFWELVAGQVETRQKEAKKTHWNQLKYQGQRRAA